MKNSDQKSVRDPLSIKLDPRRIKMIPTKALTAVVASSMSCFSSTPFGTYGGEGLVEDAFFGSSGLPPDAGAKRAGFFSVVKSCGAPFPALSGSV